MSRPLLYTISPFRYATVGMQQRRNQAMRRALSLGWIPVYSPYVLASILDDNDTEDRALGLACGRELIFRCDAVLIASTRAEAEASEGCMKEIEALGKELHHLYVFYPEALPDAEAWRRWRLSDECHEAMRSDDPAEA